MAGNQDNSKIYQFKITLKDIRPPIWRRFQIRSNVTFKTFHQVINAYMGWTDSHLHDFTVKKHQIMSRELQEDMIEFEESLLEEQTKISEIFTHEKDKGLYQYDFGDCWEHTLVLEKILPPNPLGKYPRCTGGRRACPPEDCGGFIGYYELLEIRKDPTHELYEERIRDWLGEEYDPEKFSREEQETNLEFASEFNFHF